MIPLKADTPAKTRPIVTLALIGACSAAFLWQLTLDEEGGRRALIALGAYLLLFPRASILTLVLLPFFFTTLRLPAVLLLGDWAVHGGGGVAFRAHIGGFLTGMLLAGVFKRSSVPLLAR